MTGKQRSEQLTLSGNIQETACPIIEVRKRAAVGTEGSYFRGTFLYEFQSFSISFLLLRINSFRILNEKVY